MLLKARRVVMILDTAALAAGAVVRVLRCVPRAGTPGDITGVGR